MPEQELRHFNLGGDKPPFVVSLNGGDKFWAYQINQADSTVIFIPLPPPYTNEHVTPEDIARIAVSISHEPVAFTPHTAQKIPTPNWVTSGASEQLVITVRPQTPYPEIICS